LVEKDCSIVTVIFRVVSIEIKITFIKNMKLLLKG